VKTWVTASRTSRRVASVLVVLLALSGGGCSPGPDPVPSAGPGTTSPAVSTPVPTDAAGEPIIRPYCAEPGEGRYLHAAGPTRLTPVLLLGEGPRGVVVGGQANGDICQMLPFARELVGKGYHVAVFDWTRPYSEAMAAATGALIAEGATKVVLGGFSRGALVGLGVAPSLGSPIAGVFSVSGGPSSSEGFATVDSLSQCRGPILLVGSVDDRLFPGATTAAIAEAHTGPETVVTVPGSDHALALLRGPDAARVQAALDQFLADALH
jgi:pimeloyl-ACP methyl ester carboxylesterase